MSVSTSLIALLISLNGPPQITLIDDFTVRSEVLPGLSYNVLRIDLDVTGDATPEVLLAHSRSQGTSGIQEWFVYSEVGAGKYKLLAVVGFSYLTFRIDGQGDTQRLLAYYRGQDHGVGAIVTYRVDTTGFHEESRTEQAVAGGAEWSEFETWRREAGVKVLSAELERIRGDQAVWTDILTTEPAQAPFSLATAVVPQP